MEELKMKDDSITDLPIDGLNTVDYRELEKQEKEQRQLVAWENYQRALKNRGTIEIKFGFTTRQAEIIADMIMGLLFK